MRTVAAAISWNSGSTMMAAARVVRARDVYRGFATKVISEAPASSIPATPEISMVGSPRNSAPRRLANSPNFIDLIVAERLRLRSAAVELAACAPPIEPHEAQSRAGCRGREWQETPGRLRR